MSANDDDEQPPNATPTRRTAIGALIALPVIGTLASCTHVQPVCATEPANPSSCQHRFCRYHRGT
jgi:hypothetical protein